MEAGDGPRGSGRDRSRSRSPEEARASPEELYLRPWCRRHSSCRAAAAPVPMRTVGPTGVPLVPPGRGPSWPWTEWALSAGKGVVRDSTAGKGSAAGEGLATIGKAKETGKAQPCGEEGGTAGGAAAATPPAAKARGTLAKAVEAAPRASPTGMEALPQVEDAAPVSDETLGRWQRAAARRSGGRTPIGARPSAAGRRLGHVVGASSGGGGPLGWRAVVASPSVRRR